jgi:hypothetical protein
MRQKVQILLLIYKQVSRPFLKNEHPVNNNTPENKHFSTTVLMNLQVVSPTQHNKKQHDTTRHNTTERDNLSN